MNMTRQQFFQSVRDRALPAPIFDLADLTEREVLEEEIENAHGRYVAAKGAWCNAMQFSPLSERPKPKKPFGSWPPPPCPSSTDEEKEARRVVMVNAAHELHIAEAALAA